MTDEEFVIQMYELHCQAMRDVWQQPIIPTWQDLSGSQQQAWLEFGRISRESLQAVTTIQEFLDLLNKVSPYRPVTYVANSPDPVMMYCKRFYELVKAFNWMAVTIPSTGILAPSKYKLKSSDRRFVIQGWIQMDGKPKSVSIKFLDNGLIMEIPQTDFDAEAVKID